MAHELRYILWPYLRAHSSLLDFFAIEETTGRLYVKKDLPAKLQYKFVVRATDDGLPQNNSLGVHVAVRVRETNDYAPSFTNSDYKGTVREKEESAKVVVKVIFLFPYRLLKLNRKILTHQSKGKE